MSDPFSLLNVSVDADEDTIERAWKAAVLEAHPDRFVEAPAKVREAQEQRTRDLNDALATLLDPVRRADAAVEHLRLHPVRRNVKASVPPPASGATEPPPPRRVQVAEEPLDEVVAPRARRFFRRRG